MIDCLTDFTILNEYFSFISSKKIFEFTLLSYPQLTFYPTVWFLFMNKIIYELTKYHIPT